MNRPHSPFTHNPPRFVGRAHAIGIQCRAARGELTDSGEKQVDANDLRLLARIEALPLPVEVPTDRFPVEQMYHGSRIAPKGFTNIHHFYLPRAAHAMAHLWRGARRHPDIHIRSALLFCIEQAAQGLTVLNRHHFVGKANVNQWLNGVYYIPSAQAMSRSLLNE
jgi:hypothetical protein